MISQGFRTYAIEADDFPLKITASSDAAGLPDLGAVTFFIQDVTSGAITKKKQSFKTNPDQTATLILETAPSNACNIVFALQVRFPAANPVDQPLKLIFISNDDQRAKDEITPEDNPIVFANYVIHFR